LCAAYQTTRQGNWDGAVDLLRPDLLPPPPPDGSGGSAAGLVPSMQIAPNPFSGGTDLRFALRAGSEVRVEIVDPLGRAVRSLVRRSYGVGTYVERWDGRDDAGVAVPAGLYVARLVSETGSVTRKVIHLGR
jgi:hypothetical protein